MNEKELKARLERIEARIAALEKAAEKVAKAIDSHDDVPPITSLLGSYYDRR
jgi:hypothetical protein